MRANYRREMRERSQFVMSQFSFQIQDVRRFKLQPQYNVSLLRNDKHK